MSAPAHTNRTPAFTRLQDASGKLYERAHAGGLVRDEKSLADYQADFTVEKIGEVNGMAMLWFFPIDE